VTGGGEAHLGVVLTYRDGGEAAEAAPPLAFPAPAKGADGCVLGVIGAGNFARSVLLPALRRIDGARLHTVATRRGATAQQAKEAFGFAHAAAEADAVLGNPDINAVLIATRHDSHADLAARALAAGKAVLVEKPLGMSRAEIEAVAAARKGSSAFFQVGFNRRFAPLVAAMGERLDRTVGPKVMVLRVNAGAIPEGSWVDDAVEGGGRILGEACHFVDLARFLAGSAIATVQAEAVVRPGHAADDAVITLGFADGGIASVVYTGLGDPAPGKESIEVFADGVTLMLDNQRRLTIAERGDVATRTGGGDKGIEAALRAFVGVVAAGGPAPVDEAELIETSLATVAALESLRTGERIPL
jgi:predicted dehydrogenase